MGLPDSRKANSIVGKTNRARFIPDASARHDARYGSALRDYESVVTTLEAIDVSIKLNNSAHHWVFSINSKAFAEWWPSSAKLVFNRKYTKGIHTHGSDQLIALIRDHLKLGESDVATV